MLREDIDLLVRVARLHFEQGASQREVAKLLRLSPATVSRLVKRAVDAGIVRFQIVPPDDEALAPLANRARAALKLRACRVEAAGRDAAATAQLVARAAAEHLTAHLRPGATIGVSGGRAVREAVEQLPRAARLDGLPEARVVQLMGGIAPVAASIHAGEIAADLAARLNAAVYRLHAPAIFATVDAQRALLEHPAVADTARQFWALDVALVGIGSMTSDSPLLRSGFLAPQDLERLQARGATGDICGRFINAPGESCDADLDERTLAVPLEALRRTPHVIAVAHGKEKVAAIQAAARAGLIDDLVTDEATAEALASP